MNCITFITPLVKRKVNRTSFKMESKKVIHVGEIIFSDKTNPVSHAVNQVFKIEKEFKAGEIGWPMRYAE
jgi:hypothetical protein